MSRTLYVIDQAGAVAPATTLRLSVDAARSDTQGKADQHAWLLFGGEPMRDAANAVGLHEDQYQFVAKPMGLQKLLPQFLAKPRQLMQQAHRVVCWTEGAAQIASLLGCAHVVRRINDATRSVLAERLIGQAHPDFSSGHPDREALRQQWGVNTDTLVIVLLGDRLDKLDARVAMMAMALTHEALRAGQPDHADVRLLCHPLTNRRGEASVFGELLHLEHLLIQDERTVMPWSVLPGCEIGLAPTPDQAGLSMAWAKAVGVPVIAPGPLDHAVQARSDQPKDLAHALTRWMQARAAASVC